MTISKYIIKRDYFITTVTKYQGRILEKKSSKFNLIPSQKLCTFSFGGKIFGRLKIDKAHEIVSDFSNNYSRLYASHQGKLLSKEDQETLDNFVKSLEVAVIIIYRF